MHTPQSSQTLPSIQGLLKVTLPQTSHQLSLQASSKPRRYLSSNPVEQLSQTRQSPPRITHSQPTCPLCPIPKAAPTSHNSCASPRYKDAGEFHQPQQPRAICGPAPNQVPLAIQHVSIGNSSRYPDLASRELGFPLEALRNGGNQGPDVFRQGVEGAPGVGGFKDVLENVSPLTNILVYVHADFVRSVCLAAFFRNVPSTVLWLNENNLQRFFWTCCHSKWRSCFNIQKISRQP